MENNNGPLSFGVDLDTKEFYKKLEEIQRKIHGLEKNADGSTKSMKDRLQEAYDSIDSGSERAIKNQVVKLLQQIGLESGVAGESLKSALRDAKEYLSGMDAGLMSIQEGLIALQEAIAQAPEGAAKQELIQQYKDLSVEGAIAAKTVNTFHSVMEDFTGQSRNMTQRLAEVTFEMMQLDSQGLKNTDRYRELTEQAERYTESINRVRHEVKSLSGNDAIGGLVSTMNAVSSAVSVSTGVMGLFASESENLARISTKVQSVTALAVGMQQAYTQYQNEGHKVTQLLNSANTFFVGVQNRIASALGVSAMAARGLTIALSGGLLLAVTGLAWAWSKYSAEMLKSKKAQEDLSAASREGAREAAKEIGRLEQLYKVATNVKRSTLERAAATKELQKTWPAQLGHLKAEIIMNGKAEDSYKSLRKEIIETSKARAAQAKVDAIMADSLEEEEKIKERMRKNAARMIKPQARQEVRAGSTGAVVTFTDTAQAKKDAERDFRADTDALTNLYKERNAKLKPYLSYIDKKTTIKDPIEFDIPKIPKLGTGATPVKPKDVAEAILPAGSVAEIEKRLATIDEKLRTSNNINEIVKLKEQRIAAAKELADAQLRISTETDNKEREALQARLQQFLSAHRNYEEQKQALIDEHAQLSAVANETEQARLNQVLEENLSALAADQIKKSELWSKAFGDVSRIGTKQLKSILQELRTMLKTNASNLSMKDLKVLSEQIDAVEQQIRSRNPFEELAKAIDKYKEKLKEGADATAEFKLVAASISEGARLLSDGLGAATSVAESLGISLGPGLKDAVGNIQSVLGGVNDIAAGLASGDISQVMKGIAGAIKGLSDIFSGDQRRERQIKVWASAVADLTMEYERLQRGIKNMLGEAKYSSQTAMIANLQMQKKMIQQMMEAESKKKKADKAKIAEYQKTLEGIDGTIEETVQSISSSIAQTDAKTLASQLADALTEAFVKGEDAALAFSDVVDDVLQKAVKNALTLQILEKPMQSFVGKLLKSMGFNEDGTGTFDGITPDEQKYLKDFMENIGKNYTDALSSLDFLFKPTAEQAKGLQGSIKSITEKTAGALEGQINSMRISQLQSLETMRNSLNHLAQISINTHKLHSIEKEMRELNSKTVRPLAGL